MYMINKASINDIIYEAPLSEEEIGTVVGLVYGRVVGLGPVISILNILDKYSPYLQSSTIQDLDGTLTYVYGIYSDYDAHSQQSNKTIMYEDLIYKLNLVRKESNLDNSHLESIKTAVDNFTKYFIEYLMFRCKKTHSGLCYITCMLKDGDLYFS